ncbi:MAG: choice-of-anchor tandem repeat GloVer-containing protein [Candidatus Tumulicola sp.]
MKTVTLGRNALGVWMSLASLAACSSGGSQMTPSSLHSFSLRKAKAQFQPHPGSPEYQVLFSFGSNVYGRNGAGPNASLIAVNGVLYGTTVSGGAYGGGTVFSITTNGKEQVLHSFNAAGGFSGPESPLLAVNGTLYGTTVGGGAYGGGTIFSLNIGGYDFHVLHSFGNGADGTQPMGSLIAKNGTLYGTTEEGGANSAGTVFSFQPTTSKETILHAFGSGSDGLHPFAGVIVANDTLYGTTAQGGSADWGTVFSMTLSGTETILHSFTGNPDGLAPGASLVLKQDTLYGTTYEGGAYNNKGTVFSISTTGMNERILHSFGNGSDGANPNSELILVNGRLYGTTYTGGTIEEYGTVFRVSTAGKEHVLHNFGSVQNDGFFPRAGLINVNETLYGTTPVGGIDLPSCPGSAPDCDYGTVFALTL